MFYLLLKFLHIACVVIFVGNITTGAFWAAHAHKSRDFRLIASTFDGIIRSDRLFTMPGVLGIVVTGIGAALVGGLPILGTGWVLWGIVLFIIAGIAFGRFVAPRQREIAKLAHAADSGEGSWNVYEKAYKDWLFWGLVALIAPVAAMLIMVFKPVLPAF
ncbi:MAG: DUF2269 family protein [Woeseiaceae bacterium]